MKTLQWRDSHRYLTRLNVPQAATERSRGETELAALRLLLSILATVAFSMDLPVAHAHWVAFLLAIAIIHSVGALAWVCARPVTQRLLYGLHLADIIWVLLITCFSHGASSPFIPIYLFVVLSAGFRWGLSEAMLTAVWGGLVLLIEFIFLREPSFGVSEDNRLMVRCVCLLGVGYLVGVLGENQQERRAESAVIARMIDAARVRHSMGAVVQSAFNEFSGLFSSSHNFLVAQDLATDQVYLWYKAEKPQPIPHPHSREIRDEDRLAYLLPACPDVFFCKRSDRTAMKMLALGPGSKLRPTRGHLPSLPFLPDAWQSLISVTVKFGREWRLRLFLIDVHTGRNMFKELVFSRLLFERAATALYSAYLVRRLRDQAGALERARVARELHDGAIQSLISTEMRAHILHRRALKEYPAIAPEIESLEMLLRDQVIELRELMQQIKPVEVEPEQLLAHLAEQVDRFSRDSGITARFIATSEEVQLPANTCREVLQIVREALVNIRKHAQAADVLVTFGQNEGYWRLTVTDNGVGFDFEGTLAGNELMKSAKGPAIIKERVANLGGELSIDSQRSRGSQLLIKLPQKG